MYECNWCGAKFHEEEAGWKTTRIHIHGKDEDEMIDVCPCCGSEEIVEVEEEEEDGEY